jgi:hypothetical protein
VVVAYLIVGVVLLACYQLKTAPEVSHPHEEEHSAEPDEFQEGAMVPA